MFWSLLQFFSALTPRGSMRQCLQCTEVDHVVDLIQDGTSMRAVPRRFAVSQHHEGGMRAGQPQLRLVLKAQHRAGWLAFAREHQNWQICHWRPVLFTDESRFTLNTCERRDRVWRRRGDCYAACNILQHDQFGVGQQWCGEAFLRRAAQPFMW